MSVFLQKMAEEIIKKTLREKSASMRGPANGEPRIGEGILYNFS